MQTLHILQLLCLCLIVRHSSQAKPPGVDNIRPTRRPPGVPDSSRCPLHADTIFLLDRSESIGAKYFQMMLQMIVKASAFFQPLGPQANQVGVEAFSIDVIDEIRLKDYNSYSSLKDAILKIRYIGGLTFTDRGLYHMCKLGFSTINGDRKNYPNLGIVLTDGKSSAPRATIRQAKRCRRNGIRLLAIPIGKNVNMEEILAITGAKSHVLTASSFDELVTQRFILKLLRLRCTALGSPAPKP